MTPAEIRLLADRLERLDYVAQSVDESIEVLRALADVVDGAQDKAMHSGVTPDANCPLCAALARLEALKP